MSGESRRGAGAGEVTKELQRLTAMIRELEEQLDQVIATNEGLRKEVSEERASRAKLQERVAELQIRLERSERNAAANENLAAEIAHLEKDRTRLMEELRALRDELDAARGEAKNQAGLVRRFRAAHESSLAEVRSVEAQFERAMEMAAEAAAKLTMLEEERDALIGRLKLMEEQLHASHTEQDQLLMEVEESRAALDEIRRSLSSAVEDPRRPG